MYAFKRWVDILADPLVWTLLIGGAAVVLRLVRRTRITLWLFIAAAAVGYLGSISIVGDALLRPLEQRYPPLSEDRPLTPVSYVVVLGTGYGPHDGVPITAALAQDGLVRIVEGVRLIRRLGTGRLIVSGGAPAGQVPSALGYARLARDLGVSAGSLVVLDTALDTGAEAKALASQLGSAPFILVTSSYHMPRAMRQMERAGMHPIPAPTGQLTGAVKMPSVRDWLPSAAGLGRTERALHEYFGFAALAARIG